MLDQVAGHSGIYWGWNRQSRAYADVPDFLAHSLVVPSETGETAHRGTAEVGSGTHTSYVYASSKRTGEALPP